jgi:hypothetical protein
MWPLCSQTGRCVETSSLREVRAGFTVDNGALGPNFLKVFLFSPHLFLPINDPLSCFIYLPTSSNVKLCRSWFIYVDKFACQRSENINN